MYKSSLVKLKEWVLTNTLIYVLCSVFIGVSWYVNNQGLSGSVLEIARIKGQSAFQLVQTMRLWSARHGGLYAPVTPDSPANPYLDVPDRDITDASGRLLTKINPAYMTRQLSDLLRGSNVEARLTSLKPLNPINTPDNWEKEALLQFDRGKKKEIVSLVEERYRYIAPLFVETSCLLCHEHQGYVVGDVSGALGFSFPVSQINELVDRLEYQSNRTHFIAFITIALSGTVLFSIFSRLSQRLRHSSEQHRLLEMQMKSDTLTGVLNRSTVMDGLLHEFNRSKRQNSSLSVLMLDLDYFKQVNDTYGHRAGDEVLNTFAGLVSLQLREVDYVGRYGGEEFIVLLPDSGKMGAMVVAERIRKAIEGAFIDTELHHSIKVTVSIGLAERKETNSIDTGSLIEMADQALYHAKHHGRNRVSSFADLTDYI